MLEVNFTISQYESNRKFLKVTLNKKNDKFSIIKNSSKLKDKTFHGNNSNLFISDDVPAKIRKIRKLILAKRDKLWKITIYEAWISKGIQTNLFVKRPDGSITKYPFSDSIPDVDDFPNARGHVHHSFPSDVSVK